MHKGSKIMGKLGLASLLSLLLLGCSGTLRAPNPMDLDAMEIPLPDGPKEFQQLTALSGETALEVAKTNYIRMDAVRDTAMSLGARTALAWRGEEINRMLHSQAEHLSAVFNFHGLVLEDSIMPPILLESRNALTVDNPQNIRVSDRTYQILKQAHFVSTPPTWRDYLVMDQTRPEIPDASLLPTTDVEKAAWRDGLAVGWSEGLKQADQIYQENLSRLKRDYQGMIRYRMLLAQNMVSPPQVAQRDLGITGGGESLAINDRILTIKALPSLKANTETWKPSISP